MTKTSLTKMLPMMAAAVLLATSCSEDSDNNVAIDPISLIFAVNE